MSSYVPQIPEWFNTRKAAQVTAYLALKGGGHINILRATKLIYLADRLSMLKRETPITHDSLVSMRFGPVNSYTYSYMTGAAPVRQGDWGNYISPRRGHDLWLAQQITADDLDELSRAEFSILDEVWDAFDAVGDQFDLAEWTHRFCPEWKDPSGSSIPIDYATIYKILGKDDPVELAEQVQADRLLSLTFSLR